MMVERKKHRRVSILAVISIDWALCNWRQLKASLVLVNFIEKKFRDAHLLWVFWVFWYMMSQLGDLLRETAEGSGSGSGSGSERSMILGWLEEDPIDGGDRASSKWRTLKRRLRLDWVGCCAGPPTLRLRPTERPIAEEDVDDDMGYSGQNLVGGLSNSDRGRGTRNLAEALAAERLARGENETVTSVAKVPLMRLLAETDGWDTTTWLGCDPVCCVCMGREKGAAFIPCGHTYCRVCSREIWMNRGKCPLCNRSIFDVLHLY